MSIYKMVPWFKNNRDEKHQVFLSKNYFSCICDAV